MTEFARVDYCSNGLIERGMSPAIAQAMAQMARAKNEGLDNGVCRTARTSTPTMFREWSRDVLAARC
jgi:hypothetical protein